MIMLGSLSEHGCGYFVWRIVIDSAGNVMVPATADAVVVPVTMFEFVAFWFPAL